jgi:putative DNA primase/helicase
MLERAKAEPNVAVEAKELDADPWLFNSVSGTIDLRTGEIRGHRREDLITKLAHVKYDPNARRPVFETFLAETAANNSELIGFSRGPLDIR